jgi:hypothetical protein
VTNEFSDEELSTAKTDTTNIVVIFFMTIASNFQRKQKNKNKQNNQTSIYIIRQL